MQYIAVPTRIMTPPKDDLFAVLVESLPALQEGDVVLISSKVVAIHQGRTVRISDVPNKQSLIKGVSDVVIAREYAPSTPLCIAHHTFLGAGGIDESNGNGYYILPPDTIFTFAEEVHEFLLIHHSLTKLGVIITDSHSAPFRYGATGIALGWYGIEPIEDHKGRTDLFGRAIKYERSNIVDGLAAGATVVSGEVDECIPVVIARGVPRLTFVKGNTKDELFVPFSEDYFRVLYERFLP